MQQKKYLFPFFALYFVLFYGLGVFIPYINVWFEKVHFLNGVQIGQINAISMLVGIGFAPIIGMIADKTNRFKQLLIFMFMMMIILLQIYRKAYTYLFILVIASIFEIFKSGSFPIADVIASDFAEKQKITFGIIRTFGSLGFMIGSVLAGLLIDWIGFDGTIFTSFTVSLFLAIICLTTIPNAEKKIAAHPNDRVLEILRNQNFYTILIYIICTTTIIDATTSFIGNYLVVTLQAPKHFISTFTLLMVLPEIILLPFSMKILNYFGYKKFYLLSSIIVFIRLAITGLTNQPYIVILMPLLHFTSIIISTVGNIHFFRTHFKPTQIATVLTLFTACVGVTRAIYNLMFGMIYYHLGGNAIYLIGASITLIAIFTIHKTTIFDK